jgi:hypothetical protein
MNTEFLLQEINKSLNQNAELLYMAFVGSYAYGLDIEESDVDVKGVYMPFSHYVRDPLIAKGKPLNYELNIDGKKVEVQLLEVSHFLSEVEKFNLEQFELLFANDKNVIFIDDYIVNLITRCKAWFPTKTLAQKYSLSAGSIDIELFEKALKGDKSFSVKAGRMGQFLSGYSKEKYSNDGSFTKRINKALIDAIRRLNTAYYLCYDVYDIYISKDELREFLLEAKNKTSDVTDFPMEKLSYIYFSLRKAFEAEIDSMRGEDDSHFKSILNLQRSKLHIMQMELRSQQ